MKKLIFIVISLFSVLAICDQVSAKVTDSREIELRAKIRQKDPRSISPVRAWIDNQTVYVSFLDLPSTATVVITNVETGGSVTKSLSFQKMLSVSLEEKGKYRIDINYDSEFFEGNFEW